MKGSFLFFWAALIASHWDARKWSTFWFLSGIRCTTGSPRCREQRCTNVKQFPKPKLWLPILLKARIEASTRPSGPGSRCDCSCKGSEGSARPAESSGTGGTSPPSSITTSSSSPKTLSCRISSSAPEGHSHERLDSPVAKLVGDLAALLHSKVLRCQWLLELRARSPAGQFLIPSSALTKSWLETRKTSEVCWSSWCSSGFFLWPMKWQNFCSGWNLSTQLLGACSSILVICHEVSVGQLRPKILKHSQSNKDQVLQNRGSSPAQWFRPS